MAIKRAYFVLVFFCLVASQLSAQDKYELNDILNDEKFYFIPSNVELTNSRLNFYDELDADYPVFTELADSTVQKKLNERIRKILTEQVETDSFRVNLFLNLKENLSTYFSLYNKLVDQLGLYNANASKFSPVVKSINYILLPCYKSVVSMVAVFNYEATFESYTVQRDFNYFQVYYFNLSNGKEYHAADVFKKSTEKEVTAFIEKKVQEKIISVGMYKNETWEEEDDYHKEEEEVFEEEDSSKSRKKQPAFSLKAGFPFLKAFSMAYYIPEWSSLTEKIKGHEIEIRLTIDEIKPFLNPRGPFWALINYSLTGTELKNQNNPLTVSPSPVFIPQILWEELIPYTNHEKIKTVTLKQVKQTRRNAGKAENDSVRKKQIEYHPDGRLKEIRTYEEDGDLHNTVLFLYDENNNLIKKATIKKGRTTNAEDFVYDKNKNVIKKSNGYGGHRCDNYYYYGKDYYLEEHFGDCYSLIDNQYYKVHLDSSGLKGQSLHFNPESRTGVMEYKYDKDGHVLSVLDKGYQQRHLYVYDRSGNLLSYEYDNGRHFYEYRYDERNNLVNETRYDSQNVKRTRKAEYNSENRMVRLEDKYNDRDTPLVTLMEYNYY